MSNARYPTMSEPYSNRPPTIAPRRFAPKATVDEPTSLKRCVNTRFAVKIGANASTTATRKRIGTASDSTQLEGTKNATTSDEMSTRYRRVGLLNETCLETSTASRTLNRTPKNTSALTNHV